MSLARLVSRAGSGLEAPAVSVEVHLSGGLPSFTIVGLPEATVRESRERVRSAIINSGFDFPTRRITVNLAPADLPKQGGRFDLPIALGILAASEQLRPMNCELPGEFVGELGLGGELRAVSGVLPAVMQVQRQGSILMLPRENQSEASLVTGARLLPSGSLGQCVAHLRGEAVIPVIAGTAALKPPVPSKISDLDLEDIKGQHLGRRSLEIAAAGGHSLLMIGPPGCGKTMLAERLPGILPPMDGVEALESAAVQSVSLQGFDPSRWQERPFRSPHHSASAVALIGGGQKPHPGEISLAHNGVLFLDELTEFSRHLLDQLREPLESGKIFIARANGAHRYPSRFQWISAMNPCACGYEGDSSGRCRCTPQEVRRYYQKVSGPLLDRIDLQVRLNPVRPAELQSQSAPSERSSQVRARVIHARRRQIERAAGLNAHTDSSKFEKHLNIRAEVRAFLEQTATQLGYSARGFNRVLRVAQTISDLAVSEEVTEEHVAEALQYRLFDRAKIT